MNKIKRQSFSIYKVMEKILRKEDLSKGELIAILDPNNREYALAGHQNCKCRLEIFDTIDVSRIDGNLCKVNIYNIKGKLFGLEYSQNIESGSKTPMWHAMDEFVLNKKISTIKFEFRTYKQIDLDREFCISKAVN